MEGEREVIEMAEFDDTVVEVFNPEPAWFDHDTFYAEVAHAKLRPEELEDWL